MHGMCVLCCWLWHRTTCKQTEESRRCHVLVACPGSTLNTAELHTRNGSESQMVAFSPWPIVRDMCFVMRPRMWMCDQLADQGADWILSPACPLTSPVNILPCWFVHVGQWAVLTLRLPNMDRWRFHWTSHLETMTMLCLMFVFWCQLRSLAWIAFSGLPNEPTLPCLVYSAEDNSAGTMPLQKRVGEEWLAEVWGEMDKVLDRLDKSITFTIILLHPMAFWSTSHFHRATRAPFFSKVEPCTFLGTCTQSCAFIRNIPRANFSVPKGGAGNIILIILHINI